MTNPADLLDALTGTERPPVEWRTTSVPPIPPERFGKDHYSTLAYVEVRAVDHRGMLHHEHMRCDQDRHPILFGAKHNTLAREAMSGMAAIGRTKYPTRLTGGVEQPDHDDYDCLDDMLAAGWLTVTMPAPSEDHSHYVDPWGRTILAGGTGGEVIDPRFTTGLDELHLGVRAKWGLTDAGRAVCAALRKHKEEGGSFGTFRLGGDEA